MTAILNFYLDLDMSAFAERLKLLRQARNMTQARLAKLLEIDPRAYSRWERGDNIPHLDTLTKIADILQVTLDELVGRVQATSDKRQATSDKRQATSDKRQATSDKRQATLKYTITSCTASANKPITCQMRTSKHSSR